MVEVRIRPPFITFTCTPQEGSLAYMVSLSCKYDGKIKAFKAPFGVEQLVKLAKTYPHCKIVEGQEHIDELKRRLSTIQSARNRYGELADPTKFDQLCNFDYKFPKDKPPMKHQLRGLYYLSLFNEGALFADCGIGKTATTLWDIAMKIKNKELTPGKVLVVGKLMTLDSGWHSDVEEFTELSSDILWEKTNTVDEKTEVQVVADHGPKPKGKAKIFRKTEYYLVGGGACELASSRQFNPKKHVRMLREWKQVGDIKYGKEKLSSIERHNIRAENIKKRIHSNEANIHIINHEGLLLFEEDLAKKGYEMIVIDESTAIKNPKAKIFQALLRIQRGSKYRRVLSATPSPQGPQDLWSQFFFLDFGVTLGASYVEYIDRYFEKIKLGSHEAGTFSGHMIKVRRDGQGGRIGTVEYVNRQLQNRTFVCKLDDCVDLKGSTRVLDVYLDDDLTRHYKQMEEELCVELSNGDIINVNIDLAKIGKLRQITSGFILNKEKSVIRLAKKNPKLEVLDSLLEEIQPGPNEKVVIFANYRAEIEMLLEHFGKRAEAIYGGSGDKRVANQKRFLEDSECHFLICQPAAAAYGVNKLTIARHLIFFSIDYRADFDYQAKHRIKRTGQKRHFFFWYLLAKGTIDTLMYSSLMGKTDLQQDTINMELINYFKQKKN